MGSFVVCPLAHLLPQHGHIPGDEEGCHDEEDCAQRPGAQADDQHSLFDRERIGNDARGGRLEAYPGEGRGPGHNSVTSAAPDKYVPPWTPAFAGVRSRYRCPRPVSIVTTVRNAISASRDSEKLRM